MYPLIKTIKDCQELCNIMEGCKSIEYSARCWLYNEYVDEPEIIDEEKEGLVSFNRCVPGKQRKKIFLEESFLSVLGIEYR